MPFLRPRFLSPALASIHLPVFSLCLFFFLFFCPLAPPIFSRLWTRFRCHISLTRTGPLLFPNCLIIIDTALLNLLLSIFSPLFSTSASLFFFFFFYVLHFGLPLPSPLFPDSIFQFRKQHCPASPASPASAVSQYFSVSQHLSISASQHLSIAIVLRPPLVLSTLAVPPYIRRLLRTRPLYSVSNTLFLRSRDSNYRHGPLLACCVRVRFAVFSTREESPWFSHLSEANSHLFPLPPLSIPTCPLLLRGCATVACACDRQQREHGQEEKRNLPTAETTGRWTREAKSKRKARTVPEEIGAKSRWPIRSMLCAQ